MIAFIINPVSGSGRGRQVWRQAEAVLQEEQIKYTYAWTEAPKDAIRYAAQYGADPQIRLIVAVGGDGTVHEAANGLIASRSGKPIGYIPAGSGNDFARGFGIPLDAMKALRLMLDPHSIIQADLIRSGDGAAVSSVGAGLDGQVASVTNTAGYKKGLNLLKLGKLAYVWSLIRVLCTYKPSSIILSIDGIQHTYERVWLVAICNIPYYGGGMMICPDANPTNGTASLCVVHGIGRLELLAVFPRVYTGSHKTHRAVQFLRGRQISIQSSLPLYIHRDGEASGMTPVTLEVLPAALSVIVPARD